LPVEFCVWVPLPLRPKIMIGVLLTDEARFTRNHVQNIKTSRPWTQENLQEVVRTSQVFGKCMHWNTRKLRVGPHLIEGRVTVAGGSAVCENELLLCVYMVRLFQPKANMGTAWPIASTFGREVTEYVDENCRHGQEEVDRTGHMANFVTLLKPVSLPQVQLRVYLRVGRNMTAVGRVRNRSRCWHAKRN